jgi:peptidyl-prolyl cis-trans isomerase SurA
VTTRTAFLVPISLALFGLAAVSHAQDTPAPAQAPPVSGAPAVAPAPAQIGDHNTQAVAAIVNDYVISDYDVNQRTALFLATSGLQPPSQPEVLNQMRQQVLRAIIDETLQLQEASKRKIAIKKDDVDKAVAQVAMDNNITVDQLTNTLRAGGVAMTTFRNQLTAQIAWNRLIEARYAGAINISDEQIEGALTRLKDGSSKPQFQVGEIFLAVDRPEDDAKVKEDATQIAGQLGIGAVFPNVARQFSQSPSAAGGGNIGWVQQGQLPAEIDKVLSAMQPGQISEPIKAEGGYHIVTLIDRREPLGTKAEEAPKLDPDGPIPVDRILLPLPPDTPDDTRKQAVGFAETMRGHIKSCAEIPAMMQQAPGVQHFRLGAVKLADLAMELADAIRKAPPGGVTPPLMSDAGVELFVRCDAAVRTVNPIVIPTRDEVQQQLFVQQLTVMSRSYLRDLKRDAVVEIR